MKRAYFMATERLGFSQWREEDGDLAARLWKDPAVTGLIGAPHGFSDQEVAEKLKTELRRGHENGVEYWPLFERKTEAFLGCCGLRPYDDSVLELGIHLSPTAWGKGIGEEAVRAVIQYAFSVLGCKALFAGHHPENAASKKLLEKVGFVFEKEEFYPPTGRMHPSYQMEEPEDMPNPPVIFRSIEPQDFEGCAAETVAAYAGPPWNENWSLPQARRRIEELMASPYSRGAVACCGGKVIAVLCGRLMTYLDFREFWADECSVHPDFQRRGIGSLLLRFARQKLQKEGICNIALSTEKGFPAERFYCKEGFKQKESLIFMYQNFQE